MSSPVALLPLLVCCSITAIGAGRIIREVSATRDLDVQNKKSDLPEDAPLERGLENMHPSEVVTVADRRAQDLIVNSLRNRYPDLCIVGEEGDIDVGPDSMQLTDKMVEEFLQILPKNAEVDQAAAQSLPCESISVWVDPLDGTKEFACGRVQNSTVLIGIALDCVPYAGVVLEPFRTAPDGTLGVLHIGVVGIGRLLPTGQLYPRPSGSPVITCASTPPVEVQEALRAIQADMPDAAAHRGGGCGNKLLRLLEGSMDAFLQGKGCCRWDTCAGEALLRCIGGVLTDFNGVPYRYDANGDMENRTGILAACSPDLHAKLLPYCKGRIAPC